MPRRDLIFLRKSVFKIANAAVECSGRKKFPNFTLFTGALDEFLDSLNGKNREHLKSLVTEKYSV